MLKRVAALLLAGMVSFTMAGCGASDTSSVDTQTTSDSAEGASEETEDGESSDANAVSDVSFGTADNTLAEDEDALVASYVDAFEQKEYTDDESGLTVTYNLFLPDGYDEKSSYPMTVFIADSSCVGDDATRSLTQGRGGLVWASDAWQSAYPEIVLVPTYPETILQDQNGYTTTEYVELTKRLIDAVADEYAVDTDRIYGTGQSMGCMTTLILASEYPDLYAGCMFVDGQWDVSTLSGLEDQKFVYFAAEDDTRAFTGMQEVMQMFDDDGVSYAYEQWDGTWTPDELTMAAEELFANGEQANFISWKTGTITAVEMGGGNGGMGGGPGGDKTGGPRGDAPEGSDGSMNDAGNAPNGNGGGMADGNAPDGNGGGMPKEGEGNATEGGDGNGGEGMGNSGNYHMASFDYAYNCIAVMEWLIAQTK
ncbi:MAG: hypothetical protein IJ682_11405 [Lachnospiraceae bacterium]|nr:hypothetical protein [Lachnospiraceae bacterium]